MLYYMVLKYIHHKTISFSFIMRKITVQIMQKIAYFSIKNRFWIIFFILTVIISYDYTATLISYHTPKIIDQTEISDHPRGPILKQISNLGSKFYPIFERFSEIDQNWSLKVRGGSEISDRSVIFGLWC